MIDCEPATTHKLVKSGLWPTDINHLFFAHHHFDHDMDYPCFLLFSWDPNLQNPNSARKIISDIKSIYDGDIIFSDELIQIPI